MQVGVAARRSFSLVGAVAVAVGTSLLLAGSAEAHADDPPKPALKISVPTSSVKLVRTDAGTFASTFVLLVENSGPESGNLVLRAYETRGATTIEDIAVGVDSSAMTAQAYTTTKVLATVVFQSPVADQMTITLAVPPSGEVAPASTVVSLKHDLSSSEYNSSILFAGIAALLLVVGHTWWFKGHGKESDTDVDGVGSNDLSGYLKFWKGSMFAPESDWSFGAGWATSVSALGAVLGTVLSATGVLNEILPGLDTNRLLGTSVVVLSILVVVPLFYTAGSKKTEVSYASGKKQTYTTEAPWVFTACVLLTLFVTFAELGLLGALFFEADFTPAAHAGALAIVGIGVISLIAYSLRTMTSLRRMTPPPLADDTDDPSKSSGRRKLTLL